MSVAGNPVDILMIDDDVDVCNSTKLKARNANIRITHFQTFEEGFAELEDNHIYKAVILDGRGLMNDAQEREKSSFVHASIEKLNELKFKHNRMLPFCVFTAYLDDLKESLEGRVRIFDKDADDYDEMFQYLKDEVDQLPETKIRAQYGEVFELFTLGYLPSSKEKDLISILRNIDSNEERVIKNNAAAIRTFLEAIYKQLKAIDKNLLPDEVFNVNGNPVNLEWTYRFMSGLNIKIPSGPEYVRDPIFPTHISWIVKMIKETTSATGSHDYHFTVTNYTLKCLTLGLLDLLLWFKNYVIEHYGMKV